MPAYEKMPSTIRRSPTSAQQTWAKAHDSAEETYGEGRRAHQTAYAALKHTAGGVDANASKAHLMLVARELGVPGRSGMNKAELVRAIQKASARQTARARER